MSHGHNAHASVDVSEIAVVYASLILWDDDVEITSDKLETLVHAAGVKGVEPFWFGLFARALQGADIKSLVSNIGSASAGAVAAAPAGAAPAAAAAPAADKKEDKKKKEEKEESEEADMGFGLFD